VLDALANVGRIVPDAVSLGVESSVDRALVGVGLTTAVLAVGAFLVDNGTASAFGLLTAGTVAWLVFPYSEVPWSLIAGGDAAGVGSATDNAWGLAGTLVTLATVEMGLSARESLLDRVRQLDLGDDNLEIARERSNRATAAWLGTSIAVGTAALALYAAFGRQLTGLVDDPDLLFAPAIAGLATGLLLWWWARSS
jgi:hypothetical protein